MVLYGDKHMTVNPISRSIYTGRDWNAYGVMVPCGDDHMTINPNLVVFILDEIRILMASWFYMVISI